ncbi:MAG: hypothetical protein AAGF30_00385 [Pseudomonadota bacterium]
MAQKTLRPSDLAAIAAVVDPDLNTAGTHTSGWVDMSTFQCIMAVVMAGTLGAAATLDAKLEQAKDAAGLDAKDLDGGAITQMTKAGGDDDKQAVIQCYGEDLDLEKGYTHVRLSMTVAAASSDSAGLIFGMSPRYPPASNHDAESVAEIVTLN